MEPQILYEVWKPKIAEDVEKQTVRRLCRDSKFSGTCAGTKAVAVPSLAPGTAAAGALEESWISIVTSLLPLLPEQGKQSCTRRDLDA